MEAKSLTNTIFDISLIREVKQFNVVAKDNKRGGGNADLRHVVDLEASAFICGRLDTDHRVAEHVIEHTCGNAHDRLIVHVNNARKAYKQARCEYVR